MRRNFIKSDTTRKQKLISGIIQKNISDILLNSGLSHVIPDNLIITTQNIEMSKDLKYAKIFINILNCGDAKSIEDILSTMQSKMRFLLAKSTAMRRIPELQFIIAHN